MSDEVDDDKTGAIEFKEFLRIIKNASNKPPCHGDDR